MKARKKVVPVAQPAPSAVPMPPSRSMADQAHLNMISLSNPEPLSRKQTLKFPTSLDEIEALSEPDLATWAGMASELARALWLERSRRKNLKDPQLQKLADMDRRTRNHVLIYLYKNDPERIPF